MRRSIASVIVALTMIALSSCRRAELPATPELVMRKTGIPVGILEDTDREGLLSALHSEIAFSKGLTPTQPLRLGPVVVTRGEYVTWLEEFLRIATHFSGREFQNELKQHFDFYEVYGTNKGWGDVFVTGYYEPVLVGARQRTERFTQPLYKAPPDLLSVDLASWSLDCKAPRALRGRVEGRKILPYFSRAEIDGEGRLAGKNLELAWVDPVDAFFLQIQGSGTIQWVEGGEQRVIYAEKNGAPYVPIGKFIKDIVAPAKVTMQLLERHLRSMTESERHQLMNRNPSYVFFKSSEKGAITLHGISATALRTIATDRSLFPKGTLAFLDVAVAPAADGGTAPLRRFVFDQDTGGAITGPGRVDLFTGRGDEAKAVAGPLQSRGKLYYLVRKNRDR